MPYYTDERWKDFQSAFPTLTKSLPSVLIWSFVILIDLVIAAVIAERFDLLTTGGYGIDAAMNIVAVGGITAVLYFVENYLYKQIRKLFR